MEKATIYDYARFTRAHCFVGDECAGCPLNNLHFELENADSEKLTKINEIILNWCKGHSVKTRQDKFLEMFPNAKIANGVVTICPKNVETTLRCSMKSCEKCSKEYWLAEVDENERGGTKNE